MGIGTSRDCPEKTGEVIRVEGDGRKHPGGFMLYAPDARKVVVAIGPEGRISFAVNGATGVVVDDCLVIEIDDVQRAIGPDAILDRAKPEIGAADKLGFLATLFFGHGITDAIGSYKLMMDDVERGLSREVTVIPLGWPGASFIDGAARGRGEATHLVNLRVRLLRPGHRGERALIDDHPLGGCRAGDFAEGENFFREQRVEKNRAARRLRPENLPIPRERQAPGVGGAAAILFEGRAIGLEANYPRPIWAKFFGAVTRGNIALRIAMRGVNPAIAPPAQIIDDGMGIINAKARVKFGAAISDAIAIRVLEIPNIWGGRRNHSMSVEDKAGDEFKLIGKNFFMIHDAVAVSIG